MQWTRNYIKSSNIYPYLVNQWEGNNTKVPKRNNTIWDDSTRKQNSALNVA